MADSSRAFNALWSGVSLSAPGSETESLGRDELIEDDPDFADEPVLLASGASFAGLQVRGRLGSGGMAMVYRAWDPEQGEEVALKLLNRGLVRNARHLDRFRREARVASRLRHPRVVSVQQYGETEGCAYLTMPLIEGPTLADVVEEEGRIEPRRAARLLEQIARAVDAAHRQRVVHRDLKPSNVMLHPEDGPVVVDFGLAKDLGRDARLTETGEILGTPAFLAPEQVMPAGMPVDHRIDVYGLGATLFYLLSGRQPYEGDTAVEVIHQLLAKEPERLRSLLPELPAPLEVVCAKAMARDPRDRYQTAGELADDLERFLATAQVLARLPGPLRRLARLLRRHPWTTALGVALVLLTFASVVGVRALAARMALRQRSEQGLALLARAQEHVEAGEHADADAAFLQAMLVAKGAFLEEPSDDELRGALARIKRARANHAESRGNWALAEELRLNLARLEGRSLPVRPQPQAAAIKVVGLGPDERVVFHAWKDGDCVQIAEATAAKAELTLAPGRYLALHRGGHEPAPYLVVLDAGRHELRLTQDVPAPPGVLRLPSARLLGAISAEGE